MSLGGAEIRVFLSCHLGLPPNQRFLTDELSSARNSHIKNLEHPMERTLGQRHLEQILGDRINQNESTIHSFTFTQSDTEPLV